MLIHALRIQQDLGIYVSPSSDFIPYIYPPLYPTVLAWLSEFWTLDYWMGRGVSILGSLLATSALIVGVRRETTSWSLAWLAGALWLSTYEDSGTFMDLTRADGLMMGLLGGPCPHPTRQTQNWLVECCGWRSWQNTMRRSLVSPLRCGFGDNTACVRLGHLVYLLLFLR